jgi:hypothetical protein
MKYIIHCIYYYATIFKKEIIFNLTVKIKIKHKLMDQSNFKKLSCPNHID